jgi:hypothetical protein
MPVRQKAQHTQSRRNRLLAWGLGGLALLLYGAMRLRWTQGF